MLNMILGRGRWLLGSALGLVGFGGASSGGLVLVGVLIALIPATWAGTASYYKIRSWADVKAMEVRTTAFERAACATQISNIRTDMLNDTQAKIAAAEQAASEVEPLPETDAELLELCKRSASCRNRLELLRGDKK